MKRFFVFLLILAMLLPVMCACDSEAVSGTESEASDNASDVSSALSGAESTDESADESGDESKEPYSPDVNEHGAFRFSSIDDCTDEGGVRSYLVYAPHTDEYDVRLEGASLVLLKGEEELLSGTGEMTVSLEKDEIYTLNVSTDGANADFKLTVSAKNNLVTLPYDVATPIDTTGFDVNGSDKISAAEVNYVKRTGGTYIYSNNPEQFGTQHVGKAFMRNEGLVGDVYVTFEHANYSGSDAYLGYQLKNNTDHDVYITITNVGYQWIGTWFGQLAWYDFYNTSFKLPSDYLNQYGGITSKYSALDYAYRNYTPRIYQPTTYRLPAGEYIWVIGGTSADAYRNINVDNSANHPVNNIRCANGNVKFTVTGGSVTGTMYCYTNAAQVKAEPKALGYVAAGYASQYSGVGDHHGVIDNFMTWTFNDNIGGVDLPVTYTNYYSTSVPSYAKPYSAYNSKAHTTRSTTSWMTHLNPQNNHRAVGMDMVEFRWHDARGNEIVIDNHHADGAGEPANTGNWMIEYQDHFTFVNQGDNDRVIVLKLRDHGTLATLVRDSVTGEVLETEFTAGLGESGGVAYNFTYELTVPAHSIKQVTLDYLLVACSYGSVVHAVELKK